MFKERCKEASSNPHRSPAQLTLCGNIPGNCAFSTGQAPEAQVSLPAHSAGVSWWLACPGKQQAVVGARTYLQGAPSKASGQEAEQVCRRGQKGSQQSGRLVPLLSAFACGKGILVKLYQELVVAEVF